MKKCNKCGAEILDYAKFCEMCGAAQEKLIKWCIFCGAKMPVDHEFCSVCGKRQTAVVPPTNEQTSSMAAPPKQEPTVSVIRVKDDRQKLVSYIVFTLIAQLAVIVFMFCDFGIIKVREPSSIWGQSYIAERSCGVNVFDCFHFSDTLAEIIPEVRYMMEEGVDPRQLPVIKDCCDSYVGMGVFLLIVAVISMSFYIIFIVQIRKKPSKYSLAACLPLSLIFFFFSLLFAGVGIDEMIVDLCGKDSIIGSSISWAPIAILVLTTAQFIANIALGTVISGKNIKTNNIKIFGDEIIEKCSWLIVLVLFDLFLIPPACAKGSRDSWLWPIIVALPIIGGISFAVLVKKSKRSDQITDLKPQPPARPPENKSDENNSDPPANLEK